jgi:hypothetical protein
MVQLPFAQLCGEISRWLASAVGQLPFKLSWPSVNYGSKFDFQSDEGCDCWAA